MVQRSAAAGQIEVGMRAQVDHGGLAGPRLVVDAPGIVRPQRVAHPHVHLARKAHLAIGAEVAHQQARANCGLRLEHGGLPQLRAEALAAAMQAIAEVVVVEAVFLPVEREACLGDAIGKAAGNHAELLVALDIVGEVVEAQHDVGTLAQGVGRPQLAHDGAIVDHCQPHARRVAEPVLVHRPAIGQLAELADRDASLHKAPRTFTYSA